MRNMMILGVGWTGRMNLFRRGPPCEHPLIVLATSTGESFVKVVCDRRRGQLAGGPRVIQVASAESILEVQLDALQES